MFWTYETFDKNAFANAYDAKATADNTKKNEEEYKKNLAALHEIFSKSVGHD